MWKSSTNPTGFSDLPGGKLVSRLGGQTARFDSGPRSLGSESSALSKSPHKEINTRTRVRARAFGSCIPYGELLFVYCLLAVVTLHRRERAAATVLLSALIFILILFGVQTALDFNINKYTQTHMATL